MRASHLAAAAAAALLLAAPVAAHAQARACQLKSSRQAVSTGTEPNIVGYVSGPLFVQCTNGEELRADSAVVYQAANEVQLFGRVDYQDPTRSLNSDNATYNSQTGRLFAQGNVVFTDKERGSTLRGPQLEYYRAMPGRPESQMLAPMRPHLTLVPKSESGGARRDPLEVDGDQISTVGNRYMTALGNVVIRGKDLDSKAEEAFYDADQDRLELRRNANVTGKSYALSGQFIEATLKQGKIDRVFARADARLTSDKLRVESPALTLFFANDLLQRLVAGGGAPARPVATASGFQMRADSLEAILPAQRLERVLAIGRARGEAWDTTTPGVAPLPDSALTAVPRDRDVVFGDTLIGYFTQRDSSARAAPAARPAVAAVAAVAARADTAKARPELERMEAFGSARALYRLRDDAKMRADSTRAPGINYVSGDTIVIRVADGKVQTAVVRGLKRGIYLDPGAPDSAADARTATAVRGQQSPAASSTPAVARAAPAQPEPTKPAPRPGAKP